MKKIIILSILIVIWISKAFVSKYEDGKARNQKHSIQTEQKQQTETNRFETIGDKREKIIKGYFSPSAQNFELSAPIQSNLTRNDYGLEKGDLIETILVTYTDSGQKQTALFSFHGTKLITIKK